MKHLTDILQSASEELDVAVSNSRVLVARQDLELNYLLIINPHQDYTLADPATRQSDQWLRRDEARRLSGLKHQVIEQGHGLRQTIRLHLSDGTRTYDTSIEPLRDNQGRIIGVETIAVDITDLVAAQKRLKAANARLLQLLDQALELQPPDLPPAAHKPER